MKRSLQSEDATPASPPWWKQTTVYQIYPRSFADSNGDGVGDLQGIIGRLDYLHDLGVETLWVSPFFDSPGKDHGYDIRDHYGVSAEQGTLDDVHELIAATHDRGMKIVFDMVLNHTSDEHPWFQESRRSRDDPRRDWYIWRDGKRPGGRKPPTNWKAMVGGSGWRWDATTDQWYWASFLPFQPDLNYRNPAVKTAMLDVVRHWLDQGVDGLRLDIFNALFKAPSFADNPRSWRPMPTEENSDGFFQRNVHTIDHPDTLAFARELRAVVDTYTSPERFLVGEVFGAPETVREYTGDQADGLHLVFLFKSMRTPLRAKPLRRLLEEIEHHFPEPLHPTWVFGNHDRPRSIHRLGGHAGKARLMATLQLTARGVPFVYYGEELGLPQANIRLRHAQDPIAARFGFVPDFLARWVRRYGISLNRDECRHPMPWSEAPNHGFAPEHATPWLTPHPRGDTLNVQVQAADPGSLLAWYRGLLRLRRDRPSLHRGGLSVLEDHRHKTHVLGYRRLHHDGDDRELTDVYLNLSSRARAVGPSSGATRVLSNQRGWIHADDAVELQPYEAFVVLDPHD